MEKVEQNQLALINQLINVEMTPALVSSPEFAAKYSELVTLTTYLTDLKKNIDATIKEIVKENYLDTGDNSLSSNEYKYTYVPATTRETFDTRTFKAEHSDLYKKYVKVSSVSDSLKTFKIKPDSEDTK